jgi:hypothetical protein
MRPALSHPVLLVGALLLAVWLPLAVGEPQVPRGDEATALLAAASVWHDHDLRFAGADLARGYQAWPAGPRGVSLQPSPGAEPPRLAIAPAYPLLAAPFVGLGGRLGGLLLQVLLLLAIARVVAWLRPDLDRRLLLAGLLVSGTGAVLWRVEPVLLHGLALLAPLATLTEGPGRRWRLALGVAGLAVLAVDLPVLAAVALVPVAAAGWRRLLPLLVAGVVVAVGAWAVGPGGSAAPVQRAFGPYPGERGGELAYSLPAEMILPQAAPRGGERTAEERGRERANLSAEPAAAGAVAATAPGSPGGEPAAGAQEGAELADPPGAGAGARAGESAGGGSEDAAAATADGAGLDPGFEIARRAVDHPAWSGTADQLLPATEMAAALHLRNLRDLWVGRHSGLLWYFPLVWLLLVGAGRWAGPGPLATPKRVFLWLLLPGLLVQLAVVLAHPFAWQGGPDAPANRLAATLLPLLLVAVPALPRRASLLAAGVAAVLWTGPLLLDAAVANVGGMAGVVFDRPLARMLPRELGLLAAPDRNSFLRVDPGPEGAQVLVVSRPAAWGEEASPAGLWLRPTRRTELHLIAGVLPWAGERPDRSRLSVWVSAVADDGFVRLTAGGESVLVRFDTPGKRKGTLVTLPAVPVARDLGVVFPANERIYRLEVEVGPGAVRARRERSGDDRLLGVFLSPFGG